MRSMFAAWVLVIFFLTPTIALAQTTDAPRPKQALRKIVIDAGHGGEDLGAAGTFSKEKEITLAIALKLESMLREHDAHYGCF